MTKLQLTIPDDNRILFFDRDRDSFGFLSNFNDAPIRVDGELWRSTEFYYQAQKSYEAEYRPLIRTAVTLAHAKRMGSNPNRSRHARKISWFTKHPEARRVDWREVKLKVMKVAVWPKVEQNPELKAMPLATGDAEIVEDSPYDWFWGIGSDGCGTNWMGLLLMQTREARCAPQAIS